MALLASISLPSLSFKSRIIPLEEKSFQFNNCFQPHVPRKGSLTKVRMAQFMDPDIVPLKIENLREKMQEVVPEPIKNFPWKKAEKILLERLFLNGKKALKWSLLLLFVFSFLSDSVFSLLRNQELMIPIGLFVGVLLADLFKEISQELYSSSEESSFKQQLIGFGCFFVYIKLISYGFAIQVRAFLVHVANGGLMQVLWLWRNLDRGKNQMDEQSPFLREGT